MTTQKHIVAKPWGWERVAELFEECLKLPPEARAAFLDKATAGDAALREEVESLLKTAGHDEVLEKPLVAQLLKLSEIADDESEGNTAVTGVSKKAFRPVAVGKYLLVQLLGQGGMAEVFRAKRKGPGGFEKQLAIKRIRGGYSESSDFRKLFEFEARLSSLLTHPNIVQIYDFFLSEGSYHLAMEYLDGRNLSQIMRKLRRGNMILPTECSLLIGIEICKGLDYAHTRRDDKTGEPLHIVHRDVSFKNVMISYEGQVKILDFGIAKARNRASLTESGQLRGTIQYMAPEVVAGKRADERSDIFSVGVILYELISGKTLFESDSIVDTITLIQSCELPRVRIGELGVASQLRGILLRALMKEPHMRYQTAASLQRDLLDFMSSNCSPFAQTRLATFMQLLFSKEIQEERKQAEAIDQTIAGFPSAAAGPEADGGAGTPESRPAAPVRRHREWALLATVAMLAGVLFFKYFRSTEAPVAAAPPVASRPEASAPSASPDRAPVGAAQDGVTEEAPAAEDASGRCTANIDSEPSGARILLNGIEVGKTPSAIKLVCNAPIDVTLEHPGYDPVRRTIRVTKKSSSLFLNLLQ